MGTVLYSFLNDSFLFNDNHIADNFSKFTEQELRVELSKYREFCLENITQLTEEVAPAGEAPSAFSGKSKSDLTSLKVTALDEGESFQAFRDALERGFRTLRTENDADKLRQKTEELVHELTEVQIREIDRKISSLRRSVLAEASTAVLGLAGAVHTAGWSLLAAATAAFQGYKTFEQYRRDVKLNPGYFLWKLKKK